MNQTQVKSASFRKCYSLSLLSGVILLSQWALAGSVDRCQSALNQGLAAKAAQAAIVNPLNPRPVIFSADLKNAGVVELTMTGDFAKAKKISGGGNWTGEDRPFEQFGVPITLTGVGLQANAVGALTGMVKVRGMSSADEAKFPKLKLKIDKGQETKETLFSGIKGARINTSGFYNLPEAPFREALGYEIAELLGLPTPKVQRASITYQQKSEKGKIRTLKEKQALLIENDKDLLARLEVQDVSQEFLDQKIEIDLEKTALLFAFDALIMNDDINIRVRTEPAIRTEKFRPLFNTSILKAENDTKGVPLVYDLDKSELVSMSRFQEKLPSRFFGRDMNGLEIAMINHLMVLRQRFSQGEVDQAINTILAKLPAISKLIEEREKNGLLDPLGAARARELTGYFQSAAALLPSIDVTLKASNFYREPVIEQEKSLFYSDLFPMESPMRPGTPIKVLEKTADGKFLKVLILDARGEIQNQEALQANEAFHDFIGYIKVNAPIGKVLDEKELAHINDFDMADFY